MNADLAAVDAALEQLGPNAVANQQLGALTTYRVGGTAAVGFTAENDDDLYRLAEAARITELTVLLVGRGSNMIVADSGFNGIAVHLGEGFAGIAWPDQAHTHSLIGAGAAVALPVLARQCASRGIGGMIWAVGIPGSVGGAVCMNAGGHGSDIASSIEHATLFDLELARVVELDAAQLQLGYRTSCVEPHQIVTSACFVCHQIDSEKAKSELNEIVAWRRSNQPGGQNAGSVFKNPTRQGDDSDTVQTLSAGALIDELGLKGLRVRSASVSEVHANFIVADTDGAAADVVELIELVTRQVFESSGLRLETEVRLVGFDTC